MPGGGSLHSLSSKETVEKRMHSVHQEGTGWFNIRGATNGRKWPRIYWKKNGFTKDDLKLLVPHQATICAPHTIPSGAHSIADDAWTIEQFAVEADRCIHQQSAYAR